MKLYTCAYGHETVREDATADSVPCEQTNCGSTATPNTDCLAYVGPTSDGDTRCGRETTFEGGWFCERHRV